MQKTKYIWTSLLLIALVGALAYFVVSQERPGARYPFSFGLDLVGGTELIYRAETEGLEDPDGAMDSLKEVIERRVNIFGVSEPFIQTEKAGLVSGNTEDRLIVGLPGVADLDEAVRMIGETPTLEFLLARPEAQAILEANPNASPEEIFVSTGLTGRYLSKARVEFDPTTGQALVGIVFDSEGAELFRQITREHQGEVLAILLDGAVISAPVIMDEITDGNAQISGTFTPDEARLLARDLNYGALPIPISLQSSETVGATLGEEALDAGVRAGFLGLMVLSAFMLLWYRVPGLVSILGLVSYLVVLLVLFKLIPVTLTAAGIAGVILSLGMAVDANILIFERLREELKGGKSIKESIEEGFARAWPAIRDSNISSIITAIVLFWIGTAGVKGFALTFGLGVLVSMFSAVVVSRTLLLVLVPKKESEFKRRLFNNGLSW